MRFSFSFRTRFFYSLSNSRSSQHIEEIHGNEEKTENMYAIAMRAKDKKNKKRLSTCGLDTKEVFERE